MAADFDFEALGLLDGLDGTAREERAELIQWLLDQGFSIEHICGSAAAPLMLPASKVLGDDGHYVSAREVSEASGIELELLQRLHRAIGVEIDDPDAAVLLRADGEAAARAKFFLDLGFDPDDTVALMRVVIENLGHVAEIMREAALKTLLRPGASEVELAQASEQLALRSAPTLGAVMEDLIRLELRRSFETDAVTAAERAAGTLPGARTVTVCFADLAGFTRLGEAIRPEDLERVASRFAELAHDVARSPVRFIKSIGDAVMLISFDAVPLLGAVLDLIDAAAENGLPPFTSWRRIWTRSQPCRRLVWQSRKRGEPCHCRSASRDSHGCRLHPRRCRQRCRFRVVACGCAPPQRRQRRGETFPRRPYYLTWLTFRVLAWPRMVDLLFCVRIRRNLNTNAGP